MFLGHRIIVWVCGLKQGEDGAVLEVCLRVSPYLNPRMRIGCPFLGLFPLYPFRHGLLRPDVVWFGELLPEQALREATQATAACDVFFSIGTSGRVSGARVVVINPDEEAQASTSFYKLNGPVGQILPKLVQAVWPGASPVLAE